MSKMTLKIGLPILILALSATLFKIIKLTAPDVSKPPAPDLRPLVKVQTVSLEPYQVKIVGHGEVTPTESIQLSAQVSGEVTSWHPNFVAGGLVKKGEILFQVESDDYQAALLQAEANLMQAQAALIEEQGRADVAKREAKTLNKNNVTDLYLRKPQLLSAKANVKSAEAALRIAKRNLENCIVTSPFDALVVNRDLGQGQFVNRGTPVGLLHNVEMAEVKMPIAGFDTPFLPQNVIGLEAQVTVTGRFNFSKKGEVFRDLGIVDSATRMSHLVVRIPDPYCLKCSVENTAPPLKFGQYVEVSFNSQTLNDIAQINQEVVHNNQVWLVDHNNQLEQRRVDVVREDGRFFYINNGLQQGEKILLTIPEYPQPGMEVLLAESDAENSDNNRQLSVNDDKTNAK